LNGALDKTHCKEILEVYRIVFQRYWDLGEVGMVSYHLGWVVEYAIVGRSAL
jgi:hypothetical protein